MFRLIVVLVAVLSCVAAFRAPAAAFRRSASVSMAFDLNKAANTLSKNKILTQTAQLGLLSRLEKAGFTLTSAAPLLRFAEEKDVIGVLEASSDKLLPLIGQAIETAPALLPLAGLALKTPPVVLFAGAAGSAAAAAALIFLVPDDSVANVALQTALAVPLGVLLPGALGITGALLGKTSK